MTAECPLVDDGPVRTPEAVAAVADSPQAARAAGGTGVVGCGAADDAAGPVGTVVGAAVGAVVGGWAGRATGIASGPVGTAVGAAVGAVVGGLAGSAMVEQAGVAVEAEAGAGEAYPVFRSPVRPVHLTYEQIADAIAKLD